MLMDKVKDILTRIEAPEGYPEIEWWDSGNFDDAYYTGILIGRYELAQDLLKMIGENPNEFLGV